MTRAKTPVLPTKRAVLKELEAHAESWRRSHRERDGVVRDATALHAIRCLEMAVLMLREKAAPKRAKAPACKRLVCVRLSRGCDCE